MVIEAARHKSPGCSDANSAEFDPRHADPVIATMADQRDVVAGERDMGGTMRLGLVPGRSWSGSLVARGIRQARGSPSGTGTATRSPTPTAGSSKRPAW